MIMENIPVEHRRSALNELYLDAGKVLQYLLGVDDALDTLITCNPQRLRLTTTDQEVYHALGSIRDTDNFRLNRLTKFFESVSIRTVARKQVLTDALVAKIRLEALKKSL